VTATDSSGAQLERKVEVDMSGGNQDTPQVHIGAFRIQYRCT
jgi:hypothetical protein